MNPVKYVVIPALILYANFSYSIGDMTPMIYEQSLERFKQLKEQIEETKIVSDNVVIVKDGINMVSEQYQKVNTFSLDRIVGKLRRDILGLTHLDEIMETNNNQNRFEYLMRDVDQYFIDSKSAEKIDDKGNLLFESKKTTALYSAAFAEESLNASSPDKTIADLAVSNTSANTTIASEAMELKAIRINRKIRRTEEVLESIKSDKGFLNYLSKK
ncbi:MAG: hypothetical protein HRU20_21590 [Pseudomonadales bacterium]|nr:hypothetical protein [Pseudomonadales bacterium]